MMGTGFKNLTATSGDTVTFAARWSANPHTPYVVEHFKQNIGGTYPEDAELTENLSGATDSDISPATQTYPGFTSPAVENTTISPD